MEENIKGLEETGNYRVIKRFQSVSSYHDANAETQKKIGIYLDTETTGMNTEKDHVIEIAMVPFEFDVDGNIYRVLEAYNSFNEPPEPISQEIIDITGITDDMVKGHSIDPEQIEEMLDRAVIVIAHNAAFDRPFCEKLHERFKNISWGCSLYDIQWKAEGMENAKLEYLAYKYGFFYEGHRATIDCQVGIEVLSHKFPKSNNSVLKTLLDTARQSTIRIFAEGAPFETKDVLKARGYYWNSEKRSWYIDLTEDKVEAETIYLSEHICVHKQYDFPMQKFTAKKRYSGRY